jgi:Matrixin
MEQTQRTRLVVALIALMVVAVGWDAIEGHGSERRPTVPAATPPTPVVTPQPSQPMHSQAGTGIASTESSGPGYLDLLARAELRRRIRASSPRTYLSDVVRESSDSMLHRWDNRVGRPVRVYLRGDTIRNFQPTFLDAVQAAFARWQETGVPVRFDLGADSADAEVRFAWRTQFDIDRTGETDLEWDRDGHLRSATVTISTFDPRGHPLGPDDVRVVALHEIGHLIGLDHSPDSTDLMYAKAVVRDLSERDIRTALLLYQLAPGSLR